MTTALKAGMLYFLTVFPAGFVLGAIRVLFVAPKLGEAAAVLLEAPVMLAVSWWVCRWLIKHFRVPRAVARRIVIGAMAFAILMIAEAEVSFLAFSRSLVQFVAGFQTLGVCPVS